MILSGWVYDIARGTVHLYDEGKSRFVPVEAQSDRTMKLAQIENHLPLLRCNYLRSRNGDFAELGSTNTLVVLPVALEMLTLENCWNKTKTSDQTTIVLFCSPCLPQLDLDRLQDFSPGLRPITRHRHKQGTFPDLLWKFGLFPCIACYVSICCGNRD